MSSKRNSKNRKKKGKNKEKQTNANPPAPKQKQKSAPLPPVNLSLQEATLIYELMHDVKVTYMGMTDKEKNKEQVRAMLALCSDIMRKVEILVIGPDTGEGKKND